MALPLSSEGQGPLQLLGSSGIDGSGGAQLTGSSGSEGGAGQQLPGSCLNGLTTAVSDAGGIGSGSSVGGAALVMQAVKEAYLRLVEEMTSR